MEIGAAVAAELTLLSEALYDPTAEPAPDLLDTVVKLQVRARSAVSSLLGMTVTLSVEGDGAADRVVLRLTVLGDAAPGDIASSLRLPRRHEARRPGRPVVTVVLYAATPGAFVDMAADLTFLSGPGFDATELDQHRRLALEPDVVGVVQDESTVRQAIGVLLDRGRTREQASDEIDALADVAGTSRVVAAAGLLDGLPGPDPASRR